MNNFTHYFSQKVKLKDVLPQLNFAKDNLNLPFQSIYQYFDIPFDKPNHNKMFKKLIEFVKNTNTEEYLKFQIFKDDIVILKTNEIFANAIFDDMNLNSNEAFYFIINLSKMFFQPCIIILYKHQFFHLEFKFFKKEKIMYFISSSRNFNEIKDDEIIAYGVFTIDNLDKLISYLIENKLPYKYYMGFNIQKFRQSQSIKQSIFYKAAYDIANLNENQILKEIFNYVFENQIDCNLQKGNFYDSLLCIPKSQYDMKMFIQNYNKKYAIHKNESKDESLEEFPLDFTPKINNSIQNNLVGGKKTKKRKNVNKLFKKSKYLKSHFYLLNKLSK